MNITDKDFEQLSQLLDGELPDAAADELRQRLEREPALQAVWQDLRGMNAELCRRYGGADAGTQQVPATVRALFPEDGPASTTGERAGARVLRFPMRRSQWSGALAASVALACAVGLLWSNGDGPERADLDLAKVLDSRASGSGWHAVADGQDVQPVLSFPAEGGLWCREFLVRDADADTTVQRGVACRDSARGNWHTEVLAAAESPGSADAYRPAGAGDRAEVDRFIRERAVDIPLDAAQEQRLIDSRWESR
jgi:hypothetical protein